MGIGILIAESVEHAPIWLRHAVPLALAGAHVDVDRTRVVVLLMTRRAAARHFHVQLNAVHAYRDMNKHTAYTSMYSARTVQVASCQMPSLCKRVVQKALMNGRNGSNVKWEQRAEAAL